MKKTFKFILPAVAMTLALGSVTSCRKAPKLEQTKGVVLSFDASQRFDTIRSMKVLVDKDTLVFTVFNAQYPNGLMLPKDSVDVYYVKDGSDTLRAMVVNKKNRLSPVVDPAKMKNDKLLTR